MLTSVAREAHVELRFADALFKKSDNSYQICFMAVLKTLDVESLDPVGYLAFGFAGHISQPIDDHIDRCAVASADAITIGRRLFDRLVPDNLVPAVTFTLNERCCGTQVYFLKQIRYHRGRFNHLDGCRYGKNKRRR